MIHSIGDHVIATIDGRRTSAVIHPVPVSERDKSRSSVYAHGKVWVRAVAPPMDALGTIPVPAEDVVRHS